MDTQRMAVIILAGGASSRMGADKGRLLWNGRNAVERLAGVASAAGARLIVTAGGGDHGLQRIDDQELAGGPVSGVAAAIAALKPEMIERVLVLAVDAPTLRPSDLAPLVAARSPGAAYEGLNLPFPWIWTPCLPRPAGDGPSAG